MKILNAVMPYVAHLQSRQPLTLSLPRVSHDSFINFSGKVSTMLHNTVPATGTVIINYKTNINPKGDVFSFGPFRAKFIEMGPEVINDPGQSLYDTSALGSAFWVTTDKGPKLLTCYHGVKYTLDSNQQESSLTSIQFRPNINGKLHHNDKNSEISFKIAKKPIGGELAINPELDLAVLEPVDTSFKPPETVKPMQLNSADPEAFLFKKIYKIGSGNGFTGNLQEGRCQGVQNDSIITNFQAAKGDSGSPVFTKNGKLVGVLTAMTHGASFVQGTHKIYQQMVDWGFLNKEASS